MKPRATKLLARFAVHGIDAGRLQLEDRHPAWQYKRYHQIDICLDLSRPPAAPRPVICCGWASRW